ncbi:MAG: phosphoglyceromutase [Gammaproteobacteria bacterium SG8_11]|nr:MAG: phosphoglyceromutase [Gammaproteobacteria bacterium SG8_11]
MRHNHQLVLLRHGHSEWNLSNRFTGWTDVPLTHIGLEEAATCGRLLARHGFQFDEVHLSALQRTRQMAEQLLRSCAHPDIPFYSHWRLNERHYGCLQGMSKPEIFSKWGEKRSFSWWRGYSESPPALDHDDPRHPRFDPRYSHIDPTLLPRTESLQQCQQRTMIYWQEQIAPRVQAGKRLLVISHGNTLRALRMCVEKISIQVIEQTEMPSAVPLVYRFKANMELLEIEWLDETEHALIQ